MVTKALERLTHPDWMAVETVVIDRAGAPDKAARIPLDKKLISPEDRAASFKSALSWATRDGRAQVTSRGDFRAEITRAQHVNHRRHLGVLITLAAPAVALALWASDGAGVPAIAVPGAYAAIWLFLTLTAGAELQGIYVDEYGLLTIERSGRDPGLRGDIVKLAVPTAVIAVLGLMSVALIHDIAYPPPPGCDVPEKQQPGGCISIRFGAANALVARATPPPEAHLGTSSSPVPGALSTEDAIAAERITRGLLLMEALAGIPPALWFLRRMLTGQWVFAIRPVGCRESYY
jgi:hypothetical protein